MTRRAPRIPRSVPLGRRKPSDRRKPRHLDFVRSLHCCVCGKPPPCEAAHVRALLQDGDQRGGIGFKPGDRHVVGLCRDCHARQHRGEISFWADLNVDPVGLADQLWRVSGDQEAGLRATGRFRQAIALHQMDR